MLLAIGEAAHHDARQSVLALEPHQKILVGDDIENEPARPVRLDFAPMLAARTVGRRLDDAVILGAPGIGQDDEAPVVMIDRVIVLGLARRDETRSGGRIGGIDQADLGRLMVVDAEQEEAPILGRVEAEEIARVVLLVDESVGRLGADRVAQHAARAVLVVEPDIEQVPAVGGPFERAVTVGDAGIDQSAGRRPR